MNVLFNFNASYIRKEIMDYLSLDIRVHESQPTALSKVDGTRCVVSGSSSFQ